MVDYTALRGSMQPIKLFDLLTRLFAKLDLLADQHAVQRVDAIDGCYIAAANFSTRQPKDHALRLARFAVDAMAAASSTLLDEGRPELGTVRLQAGLHCGAVCGCMMGTHGGRKYTLVGDAVNVASRMGSQGQAGAVQCSGAFAAEMEAEAGEGCGEGLELTRREGHLEVRGRGAMPTYWLRQAAAMSEDGLGLQAVANRADSESRACQTTGNGPARLGGARAVLVEPDGPLRWRGEAVSRLQRVCRRVRSRSL